MTSFSPGLTAVTSTPVRKPTPYFALSSADERHSIFAGSVMSALLSFVLSVHQTFSGFAARRRLYARTGR